MAMTWSQLLSPQRFRAKNGEIIPTVTPSTQEGIDALRTDFHIDYDRVVVSGAFRRLGRKTQVHPLAEHDMGNPPFGHTGEDALRHWFRKEKNLRFLTSLSEAELSDVQTYEGNAHSLRIVANLEMYPDAGGMRLSAASIGAKVRAGVPNSIFIKPSCRLSAELQQSWDCSKQAATNGCAIRCRT